MKCRKGRPKSVLKAIGSVQPQIRGPTFPGQIPSECDRYMIAARIPATLVAKFRLSGGTKFCPALLSMLACREAAQYQLGHRTRAASGEDFPMIAASRSRPQL